MQWVGKLDGPGVRTSHNWLAMIFLPFIFLGRAFTYFLKVLSNSNGKTIEYIFRMMDDTSDGLKYQSSNWFCFLFWRATYSAPLFHTWRLLRSLMTCIFYIIFGVPIVFWTFYKSVYNFGPEHIPTRSLFDILKQPVPNEQDQDTKKVIWRSWADCKLDRSRISFRPRPISISRRITWNKRLQDKQVYKDRNWDNWNGPIKNGPTSRITLHANKHAVYSGFFQSCIQFWSWSMLCKWWNGTHLCQNSLVDNQSILSAWNSLLAKTKEASWWYSFKHYFWMLDNSLVSLNSGQRNLGILSI